MSNQYPMLTYRGDVTENPASQVGEILGWDETYRPYEIIEAEFIELNDTKPAHCCDRIYSHTHVYLQYATADTIRAKADAYREKMSQRGLL